MSTLVAQAVLQVLVVPRVEAGKRHADRWERTVLELKELLRGPLSEVAGEVRSLLMVVSSIKAASVGGGGTEGAVPEAVADDWHRRTSGSVGTYAERVATAIWLGRRITGDSPSSSALVQLTGRLVQYDVVAFQLRAQSYRLEFDHDGDEDALEAVWRRESDVRFALLGDVRALVLAPRLPRRSMRRCSDWPARGVGGRHDVPSSAPPDPAGKAERAVGQKLMAK